MGTTRKLLLKRKDEKAGSAASLLEGHDEGIAAELARRRLVVQQAAIDKLGPFGIMFCDAAFAEHGDVHNREQLQKLVKAIGVSMETDEHRTQFAEQVVKQIGNW
jgi:hypothetical protein